jgi:phytoene dehydrogenase-like protein
MAKTWDAVVLGGGHNGLVCAAYLAGAGLDVVVLERRDRVGGAAVTEEVHRGFRFSACSYVVSLLRPRIISDLDLPRHGFELLPLDGTLTPLPDGDYLMRWHDAADTRLELERHSRADAERYERFSLEMHHLSLAVRELLALEPPQDLSWRRQNLRALVGLARALEPHRDRVPKLAKLMTMSSADFLERWFETPALLGTLSASGIIGTFLGPRSPGSAYVMLHHYMGEIDGQLRAWGLPRGGMGSVSDAIAGAARARGATVRTGAGVREILVERGAARGVVLDDGEELRARVVVSGVDPKRTFESLVAAEHLDDDFRRAVARYRIRGSSAKVNLALDGLPALRSLEPLRRRGEAIEPYLAGAISISPDVDYLERAYDDAKYGRWSRRPYMDIVIPTLVDRSLAPPGKHVMSIFVQYAPYHLAEGSWPDRRDAFADTVIETLAEHAPNLPDLVLHRQVLTPWDLEHEYGLTQGNIFHGELSLEQLFHLRPVPEWGAYRTPIRGLYLCGSGTHPGGGVMGAPGQLAAARVLADRS